MPVSQRSCYRRSQGAVDLPAQKLAIGDVGTMIHAYLNGAAFDVEFVALNSETIAVVTVENSRVRQISAREITHARQLAWAARAMDIVCQTIFCAELQRRWNALQSARTLRCLCDMQA